jgi:hypothetical protein
MKEKNLKKKNKEEINKMYFTQLHEDAIIEYVSSTDRKKKEQIYIKIIEPAFNEMVDKIVYTYKFVTLPNVEELQEECKIWLTTILEKFDHTKGKKAFSYFSVITKNWFIHQTKKVKKSFKEAKCIEDISRKDEEEFVSFSNEYEERREKKEFNDILWENFLKWKDEGTSINEEKVCDGIRILFQKSDSIDIFNKKAIYLYLRELTGLNTKQIVLCLNKIRDKYGKMKKEYDNE